MQLLGASPQKRSLARKTGAPPWIIGALTKRHSTLRPDVQVIVRESIPF
jgi:hypothetical protein